MAFLPEVIELAIEAELTADVVGLTTVEVADTVIPAIETLDAASSVDAAITDLSKVGDELIAKLGIQNATEIENLLNAVAEAYKAGELPVSETSKAIAWILGKGGVKLLASTAIAAEALKSWFAIYSATHGHTPHPTTPVTAAPLTNAPGSIVGGNPTGTPPTVTTVPSTVTVGVDVPEPNTPGGILVAQAQKAVKPAAVSVIGLTPQQAQGISVSLALAYSNLLTVMVSMTNVIEEQISAVSHQVSNLTGSSDAAQAATEVGLVNLGDRLSEDELRIKNLIDGEQTLQATATNLQLQIANLAKSIPPTTGTGTGDGNPGVTPEQAALIATIPTLATTASVTQVDLEAQQAEQDALKAQTQLAETVPPDLGTTIKDLEDCCAENSAVTNPITQGGATPSLLRQLSGILTKAYALGLVGSFVATILAIFDLPDSVLVTVTSAEFIAPIATKAAAVAISDVTWTSNVRPGH